MAADFLDDDFVSALGKLVEAERSGPLVWVALALGTTITAGWWTVVLGQRARLAGLMAWMDAHLAPRVNDLILVAAVVSAIVGPALIVRSLATLLWPPAPEPAAEDSAGVMVAYAAEIRSDRRRRLMIACAVAGMLNAGALFVVTH